MMNPSPLNDLITNGHVMNVTDTLIIQQQFLNVKTVQSTIAIYVSGTSSKINTNVLNAVLELFTILLCLTVMVNVELYSLLPFHSH